MQSPKLMLMHHSEGLSAIFRTAMPSLLDNLQQRLDDLPVPQILHSAHSAPAQEVAAGLEASPRLRVRAFPQQSQAQQQTAPAARGFVRPQRIPSSQQQPAGRQGSSRQPHLAAQPTQNPPADAQSRQGISQEAWLLELPDTPEAPRAAAAAQRQAVADVLFEEAAGQSAVADSETVSEDPSWLDDAAAYDAAAAAAEMDNDFSALEILSDDDDLPVNGVRSHARLNLSHLEHLMLLSDSEEEAEAGLDHVAGLQPERLNVDAQSPHSQRARLTSDNAMAAMPLDAVDSQQVCCLLCNDRHLIVVMHADTAKHLPNS